MEQGNALEINSCHHSRRYRELNNYRDLYFLKKKKNGKPFFPGMTIRERTDTSHLSASTSTSMSIKNNELYTPRSSSKKPRFAGERQTAREERMVQIGKKK
uniref:Uncharacterized protein n=1 Tax=Kalanchoe fedtschenkoi TaxID=63787 RepID=A0A7N0RJ59_KALFE